MRQIGILATCLALSLVGSYLTWTAPEASKGATDVIAWQATADSLTSVRWEDENGSATLTRKKDGLGSWIDVEVVERKAEKVAPPPDPAVPAEGAPPANDAAPAAPEAAPKVTETRSTFVGNETAQEVFNFFAPLYALRELPLGEGTDLASFGLDAPKIKLTLSRGADTTLIEVGGEAYGTKDRYIRLDGKVYLVDEKQLRALQSAKARLVERRLHPVPDAKIQQIAVAFKGQTRVFEQVNAADPAQAHWVDVAAKDEKDGEATTWLGKLGRVRLKGYLGADEVKQPVETVFEYVVKGDGGTWPVKILRHGTGTDATYYAESGFSRSPVEITRSLVSEPVDDLPVLFDGEKQDAPAEEDAAPGGVPPNPGGAAPAPGGVAPTPAPGGAPPQPTPGAAPTTP